MHRKKKLDWHSFRIFLPFIKRYRVWFILSIILSLLDACTGVLTGYMIQRLTDTMLLGGNMSNKVTLILFVILIAAAVGIAYGRIMIVNRFGLSVLRDFRDDAFERLLKMRTSQVEGQTAAILTKFSSDAGIALGFLQNSIPEILKQFIAFSLAFGYLSFLNWKLTIASLATVPITILLITRLSRPISHYAKNEAESKEAMTSVIQDALGGVYIEKAFNLQQWLKNKFDHATNRGLHYSLLRQRRLSYLSPLNGIIGWIPLVTCAVYGGILTFNHELTTGGLFSFIYLLPFLLNPLSSVLDFISELKGASVSAKRIEQLVLQPGEETAEDVAAPSPSSSSAQAAIHLTNVTFGYNDE